MDNTLFEKLCTQFELSNKTIYEIKQVYQLLDMQWKQRMLHNFETLIKKIQKIETDSIIEQEILLDSTLWEIQKLAHWDPSLI